MEMRVSDEEWGVWKRSRVEGEVGFHMDFRSRSSIAIHVL
jgi:hypothetical protein